MNHNSSLWKPTVSMTTPITSTSTLPQLSVPTSLIGNVQHLFNAHLSRDKPNMTAIQHDKVKRIRSENDGLIFKEHHEMKKKRNNGLLTHQQSAPLFPYMTSQNGFIHAASGSHIRPSPMFAVHAGVPPAPILLSMEQKQEERIVEEPMLEQQEEQVRNDEHSNNEENKMFETKKCKFIQEALQWSRNLEEKLIVKPDQETHPPLSLRYSTHENTISINQTNTMFTPPSTSPQLTPYSSHSHSPILTNQKQPPTFLMGTPQTGGGLYTILPHSPTTMLSNQMPILAATMQSLQQQQPPNKSPKGELNNRILSNIATPTLNQDQKFVYMLQDGTLIATPIVHERQLGGVGTTTEASKPDLFKSPKRIGSPNSDSDIRMYPRRKRRRSSSLPVNNVKSPLSSSGGSSQSTPPPNNNNIFPIVSPLEIKTESPFLTFPQITSPSTGHYNTSMFFSGMQLTPSSDHHFVMKIDGDLINDEKGVVDNEVVQPQSPDNQLHPG